MTAQDQPVVFVSLTGDEAIRLYDLDPQSGALELRATSPAHGPSGALFLHPSRAPCSTTAMSGTQPSPASTSTPHRAKLTLINKVDTEIDTPAHLITDPAGRFLLTAYYTGGGVTVHRLDDDGAIGDLVQRIDTGPKAHAILLTEGERFVFVPHVYPNNKTSQFRFDASTGQLSPNDPPVLTPPEGEPGPRHICFRPLGDVAYIVNEQGNTVTAHRFDPERGTLSIFQDISTLPADYIEGGHTAHVEVHPNGQWCYASNRGHDSIVGYNIDADGALSPFGHYPVPASPRSFNIDPTGTLPVRRRRSRRSHDLLPNRCNQRCPTAHRRLRSGQSAVLGHGDDALVQPKRLVDVLLIGPHGPARNLLHGQRMSGVRRLIGSHNRRHGLHPAKTIHLGLAAGEDGLGKVVVLNGQVPGVDFVEGCCGRIVFYAVGTKEALSDLVEVKIRQEREDFAGLLAPCLPKRSTAGRPLRSPGA